MNKKNKNLFKITLNRIINSFKGLFTVLYEENSLYAILFIIFIAFLIGGILHSKMSITEWVILVAMSTLMLIVEIINTAIENIVDLINFKYNVKAKKIKNISASASLIANIGAIIAFCVLYIPKF